ncbi:MAG: nitrogenase component I subunit alpha [Clostridiales Family XIII bacterium]|jgi:nitrogenase molybdenum-iron protein alpha chain|nr:nitrogenase component I subunit alpha [Clostridiales Family XIII bacterium]
MTAREKLLEKYSAKVYKNRKDHILQLEESDEARNIAANTRAIPGVMTARGCCYAGCKGVVVGPLKDVCVITHGPVGCGFYSWGTRRNKARTDERADKNFVPYCLSTDMQEPDIVFGGEKKLEKAIDEAMAIFDPKCVMICSTCPIGLIGDDVQAVARRVEEKYGIRAIGYSCEGYKGVSQSGGHHIANNGLMRYVIGTGDEPPKTKFSVNVLGEYNIGGDGWEEARILKRCGIEVLNLFTGDASYESLKSAHLAHLNLVMCHRSINYIAEMMKTKYGIDWLKVNFIGVGATCESLREIAGYFGDAGLTARVEEVIADEIGAISEEMAYYRSRLTGKTAGIFSGGSRSHHYQALLADLGMKTVIAGYEFAHRDDYEGRDVIPLIKEDADNKNIESITVSPDERFFRRAYSDEEIEGLREGGVEIDAYGGMLPEMAAGDVVVDDYNHFETDELIRTMKPDIFLSGIKDRYSIQKAGVSSRQIHSYDYSGPYAGFNGAANFGRDVTMALYSNAWGLVTPPWRHAPMLVGSVAEGGGK